jgi:peptidoglycan/xylan/chitin deacetylase (PgdA/CDA1 family)
MRALSLEYHDVVPDADFDASGFRGPGPNSYKLTDTAFGEHLEAMARAVWTPPERATDWLERRPGHRPLFLTFDDGGAGAYAHVAEALELYGWRGHFFVATARIGSPGFLTGSQIRELRGRGHVVGTHSHSHPTRMGACPPDQILDEWRRSMGVLADILGEPVLTGSVPGGFYTSAVGQAAARAGLRLLFTSWPTTRSWRAGECRMLGRYTIRRWSSAPEAAALASGGVRPRISQWVLFRSLHVLRSLAGDRYTRLRQLFWAKYGRRHDRVL